MTIDPVFLRLFPLDDRRFERGTRTWVSKVTGTPDEKKQNDGDNLRYQVSFTPESESAPERSLDLWLSEIGLRHQDGRYQREVLSLIEYWLDDAESSGEIRYLGLARRAG
jgi:hypothetical protein